MADAATIAQLKLAIARLSMKINRETSQAECDRMEAELVALQARLDDGVGRGTSPSPGSQR